MTAKHKRNKEQKAEEGPFNNPFLAHKERFGDIPVKAERADSLPGQVRPASQKPAIPAGPSRAVVRLERKGRGGKEATIVEKLELSAQQSEEWLRELKKALGCGGAVEPGALVFQGDLRERVKALLLSRGVKKVIMG